MRTTRVLALIVVAALATSAAAGETSYEIALDRKVEAGAKFRAVSKGTDLQSLVITVGGVVVQETKNEVAVDLDASAEILEIDEHGRSATAKLVVERFAARRNGEAVELLARGTEVIIATSGETDRYTIAGEPASDEIVKAFKLVNALPTTDESDDSVFGTKERKRVGDSWPIDGARAAETFREPGLTIADEGVSGEAKLTGVKKVDGADALTVEARIVMNGISIEMPAGFEVVEGRLEAQFKGTFPVDVKRVKLDETLNGAMAFTAKGRGGPDGAEATIKATGSRTRNSTFARR